MRPPLLLIVLGFCCCCGTQSLKCRSQDGASDEELKRVVRSCMQRSSKSHNQDEGERRFGNPRYNFDSSYGQDYRQGEGEGQRQSQGQQSYNNRWQRSLSNSNINNSNNNRSGNNTTEMGPCVAQCFFEELNMVDANGQPDRRKVSYLLTKDLRDRALRNFYMDTVQQCFRYMEQSRYGSNSNSNSNNNNRCNQSRELIKCMSEYAKAQCDDWEEHSNLLFN